MGTHMYLIVYIYTYIYVHIYTYLPTYLHTYIHTYIYTYIHMCIYTYIHIYMCIYIYIYICICVCVCVRVHVHVGHLPLPARKATQEHTSFLLLLRQFPHITGPQFAVRSGARALQCCCLIFIWHTVGTSVVYCNVPMRSWFHSS